MKILIQWTTKNPTDWIEYDSSQWDSLPHKTEPTGEEYIDDEYGWIYAINVQGTTFIGNDHVAVGKLNDKDIVVAVWNDDVEERAIGERAASVTIFRPLKQNDSRLGAITTNNSTILYLEGERYEKNKNKPGLIVLPFSEFIKPDEKAIIHGIWVTDKLAEKHDQKRSVRGWREWTDGVPKKYIKNGKVISGFRELGMYNKARHTITYYTRSTASADVADYNQNYLLDTSHISTDNTVLWDQVNGYFVKNLNGQLVASWTTATSNPNSADWPSGDYRWFFDIIALTWAGAGDTIDLSIRQVQSNGTTVIKTMTTYSGITAAGNDYSITITDNPAAGSAGDRYKLTVVGNTGGNHGSPSLTWQVDNSDDYSDGPWTYVPPEAPTEIERTRPFLGQVIW